jgi:hypothetical protein
MKDLLLTSENQLAELIELVDNHSSEAQICAKDTFQNENSLQETRSGLKKLEAHDVANSTNLKVLESLIEGLERGEDVEFNNAAWVNLISLEDKIDQGEYWKTGLCLASNQNLKKLLPPQEVNELRNYLSRPTFERLTWTKGDYVASMVAAILGLSLEILNIALKTKSPIDSNGHLRKWFDSKLHNHSSNNPIDYQGSGFGGGEHRVRTRGHDLLRFFEAIDQTAKGEFRGTVWSYGTPREVISSVTQYGNSYPQMSWTSAFINVSIHLFADFFSPLSLPLPMSSIVYENASREFRIFVHTLYKNEFNLRHTFINSIQVFLAFLTIEVWMWLQFGSSRQNDDSVLLKKYELRSAVMGILSGTNISFCALFSNPFLINIPSLIGTVHSLMKMLELRSKQNSWIYKEIRNIDDLVISWKNIEKAT